MRVLRFGLLILLVAVFARPSTTHATSIVVDGDPSDWPAGSSIGQDNGGVPDVTTPTAEPEVDIKEVFVTNSVTTMYWRIDTFGTPTRWDVISGNYPFVLICLDTDNSTSTGVTVSVCGGQTGVDYQVRITGIGPSDVTARLQRCSTLPCTNVTGSGVQAAASATTATTEISVPLAQLGITSARIIPTAVYFDNGELPNDDTTPNSGTVGVPLPGPTSVNLSSFTADAAEDDTQVVLTWETQTEYQTAGFDLLRSTTGRRDDARRITNQRILAQGTGSGGARYTWIDRDVRSGMTYTYWLDEIDTAGNHVEHEPVVARVGRVVFVPYTRR